MRLPPGSSSAPMPAREAFRVPRGRNNKLQASKHDMPRPPAATELDALMPGQPGSRVVDSSTLFGPRREVLIRHKGAVYTLRETRQGKLILNK